MRAPELPIWRFECEPVRDDFASPKLLPSWIFLRNPSDKCWSLRKRRGFLRLMGSKVTLSDVGSPAFVARRQQHFDVRCRALLDFEPRHEHEEAGLTLRANEHFYYALAVRRSGAGRVAALIQRLRGGTRVVAEETLGAGPILLEIVANADTYAFSARTGRRRFALGKLPTRQLSAESVSRFGGNYFTGTVVGMYATGNGRPATTPADFDWFEYDPA
jgi:alpha-N-arabinofuranosidase